MSNILRRVSLGTDFANGDKRRAYGMVACVSCGIERVEECDHGLPLEYKGESTWDNLVPLCKSCHGKKSFQQKSINTIKDMIAHAEAWLSLKGNPAPVNAAWLRRMESNKRAGDVKRHLVERDRKAKKDNVFNVLSHHPLKEG